jgi:hypothetical protein
MTEIIRKILVLLLYVFVLLFFVAIAINVFLEVTGLG